MKNFFSLVIFLLLSIAPLARAQNNSDPVPKRGVLFVFDISTSMRGLPLANTKASMAKIMSRFPADAPAGLITFNGCEGKHVVDAVKIPVPIQEGGGAQIMAIVPGLIAGYWTELQRGMEEAYKEVLRHGKKYCIQVILLSDGTDTCGGDSAEVLGYTKQIMDVNPGCNKVNAISLTDKLDQVDIDLYDKIEQIGTADDKAKAKKVNAATDKEGLEEAIEEAIEEVLEKKERKIETEWEGSKEKEKKEEKEKEKTKIEKEKTKKEEEKKEEAKEKEKEKKKGSGNN